MKTPIAAIVLAAGASSRLGQPKQLLVHGGETLIERAIRLANEAGVTPVLAVLGAHYERICATVPLHTPDGAIVVWDPLESTCRHASLSIL